MKLIIIQILVSASVLFMSCNASKDMSSTSETPLEEAISNPYSDSTSEFKNVSIESQSTYAGVYSNLKGTTKYEIAFSAEVTEDLVFKRLLVDSIAIDISRVIVDGTKIPENKLSQSSELVKLIAFRNIYSTASDAPQVHEVVTYESTGLSLGKSAVIEYYKGNKPYYIEVSEIKVKQAIYAP